MSPRRVCVETARVGGCTSHKTVWEGDGNARVGIDECKITAVLGCFPHGCLVRREITYWQNGPGTL